MSILICGMDIPKNEPLLVKINPDGSVSTTSKNGYKKYEAVPVPPHGRLIDADALIERIDGIWDCNDMVFKPNDHCCNVPEDCKGCKWYETKEAIKRLAVAAPTIIPASGGKEDE